MLFLKYL